ncbi:MAG: dockerin type I domain-containing protein, partial [Planctomycetota bacterium]
EFSPIILGDTNGDGQVGLLDVEPFVNLVSNAKFLFAADINKDGDVTLLDVEPFIELLIGN